MRRVPFTLRGFEQTKARLKRMREIDRHEIIRAIGTAREHGDLSENAEYHAAKERQGFIEAEIRQLEDAVSRAEIVDPRTLSGDRVVFGATVKVCDLDNDEEHTYQIVGAFESDSDLGRISYVAPLARAMIGKEEGDEVEVKLAGGVRALEILEVTFE